MIVYRAMGRRQSGVYPPLTIADAQGYRALTRPEFHHDQMQGPTRRRSTVPRLWFRAICPYVHLVRRDRGRLHPETSKTPLRLVANAITLYVRIIGLSCVGALPVGAVCLRNWRRFV